jgi:hypothetical protein
MKVDTFVCALIIGPIFTTVSLGRYFFSRDFATFFLNIGHSIWLAQLR